MKVYCFNCGHPAEYTSKQPKFCQHCGNSLATTKIDPPDQEEDDETDDQDEEVCLPDLDQLEIEIRVDNPRSFTFGEIFKEINSNRENAEPDGKEKE
jgi:hypothetical protein